MMRVRFQTCTSKEFGRFQKDLDRAIDQSLAGAVTTRNWVGTTLHTIAPAARGFIRFDNGAVDAEVQISFPAIPMRKVIEGETCKILTAAGGGNVTTFR